MEYLFQESHENADLSNACREFHQSFYTKSTKIMSHPT